MGRTANFHRGCLVLLLLACVVARSQEITVTARVALAAGEHKGETDPGSSSVVLWLSPMADSGLPGPAPAAVRQPPRLVQRNKNFEPHVLVVPVGSLVEFPNRDPFFHNVFSLFEGKRFDLGLYEAGTTRSVLFDKPGVSYIFCNIHAEMSAVVVALDTPYYGVADQRGQVVIAHVPSGRYLLHIWYEAMAPETLKNLTREVTVSEANSTLGVLHLAAATLSPGHKNKYGRDYDQPTPAESPGYQRP